MSGGDTAGRIFLNIVNIIVGILICICGVLSFITFNSFNAVIIGVYEMIFGAGIVLLEVVAVPRVARLIQFYFYFSGRGLLFIFFGVLCLSGSVYSIAVVCVTVVVGIIYCMFECFSVISFPEPFVGKNRTDPKAQPGPTGQV